MRLAGQKWNLAAAAIVTIALAGLAAPVGSAHAAKPAPRPYRLIDAGTLGGPQSFLNLPGIPITPRGALLGTADTSVADSDYPNFNPFVIGFPDPFTAHAFSYRNGHMSDLGALPGNNSSAVFQVNGDGVGAGLSETGAIDPLTGWPALHAVIFENGRVTDLGVLPGATRAWQSRSTTAARWRASATTARTTRMPLFSSVTPTGGPRHGRSSGRAA
jgi:probable HAF family extracellular repeat protein